MTETNISLLVTFTLLLIFIFISPHRNKNKPLPPGPPKLPLIGNIHQQLLANSNPWTRYRHWHAQYGPLISLKYGRRTTVIIGSHATARDLLDRRADIYSSRPRLVVAGSSYCKNLHTVLLPYGARWRLHHRIQASFVHARLVRGYRALQDVESKQLLYDVLTLTLTPTSSIATHFQRLSSSVIFGLAYGKRMERGDELEILEMKAITASFLSAASHDPRRMLVESFPVLNGLPRWMAPWKGRGDRHHERTMRLFRRNMADALRSRAWNWVKEMHSGKVPEALEELDEDERAYVVGVLHEAGSHSTSKVLEVFVKACALHPDAVRRVQAQLEAVVGDDRMPGFEDMAALPLVKAFLNEVLRWQPITPEGAPHATSAQDEYMGYVIPEGATVIANHWVMDMDETWFPQPQSFRPERWLENPNLPLSTFGFGRRACIGQSLARNTLFIVMARMLWAYEIELVEGEQANDAIPSADPVQATFRVRSEKRRAIIEMEWNAAEKDVDVILSTIVPSETE